MVLSDVWEYVVNSYTVVNGRFFTNLLLAVAAWLGGLKVMQIFIPMCILGIYLLIYNMVLPASANAWKKLTLAVFLCFSFGMFELNVCNEGLYWFAAAFGYIVPTLGFLFFCKQWKQKSSFFMPIIALLLCLSCEQAAGMTIVYIVTQIILQKIDKCKVEIIQIITLVMSFVGAFILVSSPASQGRLTNNIVFSSKTITERVLGNMSWILDIFFNRLSVYLFVCFIFSIFSIVAIKLLKSNKRNIIHIIYAICTVGMILLWGSVKLKFFENAILKKEIVFLYFVIAIVEMFVFYLSRDRKKAAMVLAMGAAMAILLFVPELPDRTFILFMFMMIFFGADIYGRVDNRMSKILLVVLLVPFIFITARNMITIYTGYEENAVVWEYNNSKLIEARDNLENNIEVHSVELYKVINEGFGGRQVYEPWLEEMKFYMDEFYSLPYTIEYLYYDYLTKDNEVSICHFR